MFNYAIRITRPYMDCSGIISRWADRSNAIVVYQHDADEEISKTHIHLAIYGSEVKAEALKRMWEDVPGKGNEFWSWKEWIVEQDNDDSLINSRYLTYMSKGTLRPVFVKNFSNAILENSRQGWVEPVKADKPGDLSERIVNKVVNKIKNEFVYHKLTDDEIVDRVECSAETLLKLVRSETFRCLWGENRRVPHASHYKIVAGTAYMRLCEHYNCFEEGMSVLTEKWY